MIYSQWDPDQRRYDYYQAGLPGAGPDNPHPALPKRDLGVAPEQAAWRLPLGAKKIGHGPKPRGAIATRAGLGDVVGRGLDVLGVLGLGLMAYGAWRLFVPARGRRGRGRCGPRCLSRVRRAGYRARVAAAVPGLTVR